MMILRSPCWTNGNPISSSTSQGQAFFPWSGRSRGFPLREGLEVDRESLFLRVRRTSVLVLGDQVDQQHPENHQQDPQDVGQHPLWRELGVGCSAKSWSRNRRSFGILKEALTFFNPKMWQSGFLSRRWIPWTIQHFSVGCFHITFLLCPTALFARMWSKWSIIGSCFLRQQQRHFFPNTGPPTHVSNAFVNKNYNKQRDANPQFTSFYCFKLTLNPLFNLPRCLYEQTWLMDRLRWSQNSEASPPASEWMFTEISAR